MKDNVVYFPSVAVGYGQFWHGGRGRKTKEELREIISPEDYRRIEDWESRRHAPPKTANGGGNAA